MAKRSLFHILFLLIVSFGVHAEPVNNTTSVKYLSGHSFSGVQNRQNPQAMGSARLSFVLNEQGVEEVFRGNTAGGRKKLEEALKADPKNSTALYNLAGLEMGDSRPLEAIKLMQAALLINPDDKAFLSRMAEARFANKDLHAAIEYYEKVFKLDPNFAETALRLGTIYGMTRQWEKAELLLRKAVALHPKNLRALSNLGSTLVVVRKFQEAVDFLSKALSIEQTADNAMALGIAFEGLGQKSKALEQYYLAKKLGRSDDLLSSHIKHLEQ